WVQITPRGPPSTTTRRLPLTSSWVRFPVAAMGRIRVSPPGPKAHATWLMYVPLSPRQADGDVVARTWRDTSVQVMLTRTKDSSSFNRGGTLLAHVGPPVKHMFPPPFFCLERTPRLFVGADTFSALCYCSSPCP